MKRNTVVIITVILISGFLALVFYGLRHSRGAPVIIEEPPKMVLEAPFIDKEIDLSKGVSHELWEPLPSKKIEMFYQTMALPWGGNLIASPTVKAFHNKKDIYIYLSWLDETEDRDVRVGKFSDACGIMFSLDPNAPTSTIMMGFMGQANLWQWKASQDREYWLKETSDLKAYVDFYYPLEEQELFPVSKVPPLSAVNDLVSIRIGTVTLKDAQNVQGRGIFERGRWSVVFRRAMSGLNKESDADFVGRQKHNCVFAIWNGGKSDRGGRKSISEWVEIDIK